MSTTVANYICSKFQNEKEIDSELLLTTRLYLEFWKNGSSSAATEDETKIFEEEDFSEAPIDFIKQRLIMVAGSTSSITLFNFSISALRVLNDRQLQPLITTWLHMHLRKTLDHHSALFQLLGAADDLNPGVITRSSYGSSDIEDNISDARAYILSQIGIHVP